MSQRVFHRLDARRASLRSQPAMSIRYAVPQPDDLAAYLKSEAEKWGRVIRDARIKGE